MAKVQKLKIFVFKDPDFKSRAEKRPIIVQINPEKYSHTHQTEYETLQGTGTAGAPLEFSKIKPEKVSFELLLDGTGVYRPIVDVGKFIRQFKKLVYDYNGEIHSPNYLKLVWGEQMVFRCVLTQLDINYTMFKPDGNPLRATLNVSFEEFQNACQVTREEQRQSPDLTHVVLIKAGDTLPVLCNKVYGTPDYYLQVAKINRLKDFRNLPVGRKLSFPPVDKTVN